MKIRSLIMGTAVVLAAASAAVPAAQAQTLSVTGQVTALGALVPGQYTYTYQVTPSGLSPGGAGFNVDLLDINFSDANVTFRSATNAFSPTGVGPGALGLTNNAAPGVFIFDSGTLTAGNSEFFAFNSPDAPGGTLGAAGVAFRGSGVASINGIVPAPTPEPGSLASMAVLSACLGLGIVARRRKMLAD